MASFRKLAAVYRNPGEWYHPSHERNILVPALLEIAHAISRGRKPTTCSLVVDEPLQEWLRRMFYEVAPFCQDYMGDSCSRVVDLHDFLILDPVNQQDELILRAIQLCGGIIRPTKLSAGSRGDFKYQENNEITNLKRKQAWKRRRDGSCYDETYDRASVSW